MSFLTNALQLAAVFYGGPYAWAVKAAALVASVYDARVAQRRAKQQANDSTKDRLEMVDLAPDAPRHRVYGRVRFVEGVRRRWQSGVNKEKLTLIVSFAGHEIDAYEQWYLGDTPVDLDSQGWVQTAPWFKAAREPRGQNISLSGAGTASVTLSSTPIAGTVRAVWTVGSGTEQTEGPLTLTMTGVTTADITGGPAGVTDAFITWEVSTGTSLVRIRPYRGTATQNVGADLAAEYPGQIDANSRGAGVALAVVDVLYDPDVFPQGRPTVTARFRGAKIYQPNKDGSLPGGAGPQRANDPSTWTWTDNSADCAFDYFRYRQGWACTEADAYVPDVMQASARCDVPTAFTLRKPDNSTQVVNLPRYRCNVAIDNTDPRRAMDDIVDTMAGRWGWAGGMWRLRAGMMRPQVATVEASWLAHLVNGSDEASTEPVVRVSNGVARDQQINRVKGRCVDPDQRYQLLPYPAVSDAVLIAAKGLAEAEIDFPAVAHPAHAQHLGSIRIREAQASLRMELTCSPLAWRMELFDVVNLLLPRYGMTTALAKTAEVEGWRWHPTQGVSLRLAELTEAIFEPLPELRGVDPAPNSALRRPWQVEQVLGLAVTSGSTTLQDGSIIARAELAWTPAVGASVRQGGKIEIQYSLITGVFPTGDWPGWEEDGSATRTVIPGLQAGRYYRFRARYRQPLPLVRGPWSPEVVHRVAERPAVGWNTVTGKPPDDDLLNSRAGAVNMLWGAGNGPVVVGPGLYGATVQVLRQGADNPHGLKPGEKLVISADLWQDAVSQAASQYAQIYLYSAQAGGAWQVSAAPLSASLSPSRQSATVTLPAADADMHLVAVGLYHQGGATNLEGTVYGDRIQVERGGVATPYKPGAAPGATRNRVFRQNSPPTGDLSDGDWWYDTDDGNLRYVRSGGVWVPLPGGAGSLSPGAASQILVDEYNFGGASFGTGEVRSFTFTPPVSCDVEFTATIVGAKLYYDAGQFVRWTYQDNVGGPEVILGYTPADSTARQQYSLIKSFPVTGGLTYTIRIIVRRPIGNPDVQLWESNVRLVELRA